MQIKIKFLTFQKIGYTMKNVCVCVCVSTHVCVINFLFLRHIQQAPITCSHVSKVRSEDILISLAPWQTDEQKSSLLSFFPPFPLNIWTGRLVDNLVQS